MTLQKSLRNSDLISRSASRFSINARSSVTSSRVTQPIPNARDEKQGRFISLLAEIRIVSSSIGLLFQILSGYLNCDFSYVTQDDVIMGTLTVRENLEFAANLRLRNCTRQDIEERVNELIHDLGLEKCMDTKVGTELIKGVSGALIFAVCRVYSSFFFYVQSSSDVSVAKN